MSLNKFNAAYSHCTPTKHDRILNGETYIRLRVFPRKMGTKVGENGPNPEAQRSTFLEPAVSL